MGFETFQILQKLCNLHVWGKNGMLLQYIKEPTQKVIETALSQAPRAIQFVENPTEELLKALVEKDWAVLEYISNPSDTLIQSALAQSGWAIRILQTHLKNCN